jgi:hypothetical protein
MEPGATVRSVRGDAPVVSLQHGLRATMRCRYDGVTGEERVALRLFEEVALTFAVESIAGPDSERLAQAPTLAALAARFPGMTALGVSLWTGGFDMGAFFADPPPPEFLARLRKLRLSSLYTRPVPSCAIAALQRMTGLRHLDLGYSFAMAECFLGRSPSVELPPALEVLDLEGFAGATALAARLAPVARSLEYLRLGLTYPVRSSSDSDDDDGYEGYVPQPVGDRSRALLRDLAALPLHADGPGRLHLHLSGIDADYAADLSCAELPALGQLSLSDTRVGHRRGPAMPWRTPYLRSLKVLSCSVAVDALGALLPATLVCLDISNCFFDPKTGTGAAGAGSDAEASFSCGDRGKRRRLDPSAAPRAPELCLRRMKALRRLSIRGFRVKADELGVVRPLQLRLPLSGALQRLILCPDFEEWEGADDDDSGDIDVECVELQLRCMAARGIPVPRVLW